MAKEKHPHVEKNSDLHSFLFAVIQTPVKRHKNNFNVFLNLGRLHDVIYVQRDFSNPLAIGFAVHF